MITPVHYNLFDFRTVSNIIIITLNEKLSASSNSSKLLPFAEKLSASSNSSKLLPILIFNQNKVESCDLPVLSLLILPTDLPLPSQFYPSPI